VGGCALEAKSLERNPLRRTGSREQQVDMGTEGLERKKGDENDRFAGSSGGDWRVASSVTALRPAHHFISHRCYRVSGCVSWKV
jgi:hypothetical protein